MKIRQTTGAAAQWAIVAALACLLPFASSGCGGGDEGEKPKAPNLLFVVIDTLRADQLALYGGPTSTPSIEALARRGVVFEQAYCHIPMTGPSHSTMFTSLLPSDHNVHNNSQVLRDRYETLAEILSDTHHTAAFISLAAMKSKYGYLQGFDEIHEDFPRYWWKSAGEVNEELLPWLEEGPEEPFFLLAHYSDPHGPYTPPDWYQPVQIALNGVPLDPILFDGRNQRVKLPLREGENEIAFTSHGPHRIHLSRWKVPGGVSWKYGDGWEYDLDGKGRRKSRGPRGARLIIPGRTARLEISSPGRARTVELKVKSHFMLDAEGNRQGYAAETAYADAEIGRLFALMEKKGLSDNTIVVLTGDHGEELGERDGFMRHGDRLYENTVHVPLIIATPDGRGAGERVPLPVGHVDLLPTLAGLMGFAAPKGARGADLFPLDGIGKRPIVMESYRKQAKHDREAVRLGEYKLIRTHLARGAIDEEMYDIGRDPSERRDLLDRPGEKPDAGAGDEVRSGLSGLLDSLRKGDPGAEGPVRAELTEEDEEALRALGYVL